MAEEKDIGTLQDNAESSSCRQCPAPWLLWVHQTAQQRSSMGSSTLGGPGPGLCHMPGWEPRQWGRWGPQLSHSEGHINLLRNHRAAGQAVQPVPASRVGRGRLACWRAVRAGIASARPMGPSAGGGHAPSLCSCAGRGRVRSRWLPPTLPAEPSCAAPGHGARGGAQHGRRL